MLILNVIGLCIDNVTLLDPGPLSASVNRVVFSDLNGLTNFTSMSSRCGGSVGTIPIRPSPAFLLPFHSWTAPTPRSGPGYVCALSGESPPQGAHCSHRRQPSCNGEIRSGAAGVRPRRWTGHVLLMV